MDSALELRIARDAGESISKSDALEKLERSPLVARLTREFDPRPTYCVWRLLALSEIPFAEHLPYTRDILAAILKKMETNHGFSLFGSIDDLLPCYNSMLVTAFSKLNHAHEPAVRNGVDWILEYQPRDRLVKSKWNKKGVRKYGGCFHDTPCYIGVAKSIQALQTFQSARRKASQQESRTRKDETAISAFIKEGTEYLLSHKLYMRLRDEQPIIPDILCLSFPYNYKINVLELLEIAANAGELNDPRCFTAMDYVRRRRMENGYWKTDYNYKAPGYISFDNRRGNGEWVSHLMNRFLL